VPAVSWANGLKREYQNEQNTVHYRVRNAVLAMKNTKGPETTLINYVTQLLRLVEDEARGCTSTSVLCEIPRYSNAVLQKPSTPHTLISHTRCNSSRYLHGAHSPQSPHFTPPSSPITFSGSPGVCYPQRCPPPSLYILLRVSDSSPGLLSFSSSSTALLRNRRRPLKKQKQHRTAHHAHH